MFSIFNRRVVKKEKGQNAKQERIANHIFNTTIKFQQKWAAYLQNKTNRLSTEVKIWLLIAFCFISIGYSIYRLKYSFTTKSDTFIQVERFIKTDTNNKSGHLIFIPRNQVPTDGHRRIQQFLNYMDSLNLTPSGRKIHDSVLKNRPGLMDSVRLFEKMSQSKSILK
jgi:hypothetical protein